ncbi:MAG: hypothetical protein LCH84_18130 [Gemmatimonadetes bacterium]|nr:hypothetical protein [Gemmatimonadota bacterium]
MNAPSFRYTILRDATNAARVYAVSPVDAREQLARGLATEVGDDELVTLIDSHSTTGSPPFQVAAREARELLVTTGYRLAAA